MSNDTKLAIAYTGAILILMGLSFIAGIVMPDDWLMGVRR